MSLIGILNVGKSAIFASQNALNVVNHNISNVNTPGYTRQDAVLEIATPVVPVAGGYLGTGVDVQQIARRYDRFVSGQLLGQEQNYGKSSTMDQVFGKVEQIFNESGDVGLSRDLSAFFAAWNAVSSNPEDTAQRTVLLSKAGALVSDAQRMETGLLGTVREINGEIADVAKRVNEIATDIARLNARILEIEAGGGIAKANDLRDTRDQLVSELSGLADVTTREDRNGSMTVTLGMRNLVDGERVNALSTVRDAAGDVGLAIDGVDVTSRIVNGRIGGLLESRSAIETGALSDLRRLAAAVAQQTNLIHRAGYGLDGSTGNDFFAPLSLSSTADSAGAAISSATIADPAALTLSEYAVSIGAGNSYTVTNRDSGAVVASGTYSSGSPIDFEGIRIVVSGTVAAGDAFTVSPLSNAVSNFGVAVSDPRKIAAASAASGLPGDNANALRIAALADASVSYLGGATFSGYYGGIVSKAGSQAQNASDLMKFDDNIRTELRNRRDAASGVNLDEEAIKLIAFQRAFEAAARMIKITDELLQTVLQL